MNRLLVPLVLCVAACSPAAEQTPANQAEPAVNEQAEAKAPTPLLEGEWVVEQINGKAPDQVWPMTAEVTKDRFTIVSECRRMTWALEQKGNIVKFTRAPGGDCGRVLSPAEHLIDKGVGLANIAMFGEDGRTVQLNGAGGIVSMSRR